MYVSLHDFEHDMVIYLDFYKMFTLIMCDIYAEKNWDNAINVIFTWMQSKNTY